MGTTHLLLGHIENRWKNANTRFSQVQAQHFNYTFGQDV